MTLEAADLVAEFDAQTSRLVALGYPSLAGTTTATFRRRIRPLRERAAALPPRGEGSQIPFVVVVPRSMVATEEAMHQVCQGGRSGYVGMHGARSLEDYRPIEDLEVPDGPYLAVDPDPGDPGLNLTCEAALPLIRGQGRSPLTIDEGVALATQRPGILRSATSYWLMGERAGDRRVPALWVSRGAPRLGWCWAGTPHDWLGPASCASRLGRAD